MKLIITEKPSVGQSIAGCMKAVQKHEGYIEGNGIIVTWCVGHLVELLEPEAYDERYRKWKTEDLPIIPDEWQYRVCDAARKQFQVISRLMKREDVDRIICATDAGREGELIFRLVYKQAGCKKPFDRLWISSMEDEAVRAGFKNLRPGYEYDRLYEAALCRERADWIVGINATRLFSSVYHRTLNIGRVMTPTLAMVAQRDKTVKEFVSVPFYTVQIDMDGITAESRRFAAENEAEAAAAACRREGYAVVSSVRKTEKTEHPPLLYDLTGLQRDANRMYGFTAKQTLDYMQSLYEKKIITYPRTDSRYLTEDMRNTVCTLAERTAGILGIDTASSVSGERVIDQKKVTDHHAVIPTEGCFKVDLTALPSGERTVFRMIAARLVCAVSEDHRYSLTELTFTSGNESFSAKSREIILPGWKAVYERMFPKKITKENCCAASNAVIEEGNRMTLSGLDVKKGKTSPPEYYTEDTLLNAMQTSGADGMPDECERKGIGTPATRAAVIEKLVSRGFINRKGKGKKQWITASDSGNILVAAVPELLKSASMTAQWEQKLYEIEQGDVSPEMFMDEIEEMILSLIKTYKDSAAGQEQFPKRESTGICPHCGCDVMEMKKGWFCRNTDCRFVLWKENAFFNRLSRKLNADIVKNLLESGETELKGCRNPASGRKYDCILKLQTKQDGSAVFSLDFGRKEGKKDHDRTEAVSKGDNADTSDRDNTAL